MRIIFDQNTIHRKNKREIYWLLPDECCWCAGAYSQMLLVEYHMNSPHTCLLFVFQVLKQNNITILNNELINVPTKWPEIFKIDLENGNIHTRGAIITAATQWLTTVWVASLFIQMIKMDVRELQDTGNWWTRLKWEIIKGVRVYVDLVLLRQNNWNKVEPLLKVTSPQWPLFMSMWTVQTFTLILILTMVTSPQQQWPLKHLPSDKITSYIFICCNKYKKKNAASPKTNRYHIPTSPL